VSALASGVLAGYYALRSERMRHREARKAAHVGSVREHTAAFFAELFAIHFAANWVAWFAEHDPGALDHGMAESYDTETYRAFPKLLGSTAMVAALNTGVYEQLKPLIIEVYKLWERVMHGPHQLVFRERGTLTARHGSRTMVHAVDCEGGGSAARS